jgi:hypothetical protein
MQKTLRAVALIAATFIAVPLSAQRDSARIAAALNSQTTMPVIIPAGTPLKVVLDRDISSESVNVGDTVSFHMAADYSEFNHVLISAGQTVRGSVASVERRKSGGRPGVVTVSVKSVRAVDGTYIPLRGTKAAVGMNRQGQAAALGVLTLGIGTTKKGLSAAIPAGTEFTVFTNTRRTVVVAR